MRTSSCRSHPLSRFRSALSRPFTPGDLANRCTVVNRRNLALTKSPMAVPERFDLVLDLRVVPQRP